MKRICFYYTVFVCLFASPSFLSAAESVSAMAVTAEPTATKAALEILGNGGNAVDAAIAAQWVLNVTEPQSSGIGGGGFLLFYSAAEGKTYFYDGRETAPAQAYPQMFLGQDGEPLPFWPDRNSGGLPVGVPGTLKLLETVHERHGSGRFTFGDLFQPAIRYAREGVPVSERLNRFLEQEKKRLELFEETSRIFFDAQGNPHPAGHILKQLDLARTFELIAGGGTDVFYGGEIAEDIIYAVRNAAFHPGHMSLKDLEDYRVKERMPVETSYRDYRIVSPGPPSSGGTTLAQTLNILEHFDLSSMAPASRVKVLSKAQYFAFQDRLRYLGDPDFVDVPVEKIISKDFAANYAEKIKTAAEIPMVMQAPEEGQQTSHLSIRDSAGNIVSYTTTIEHLFGSAMIVPGRGFFLNNELTDFEAEPHDEAGGLKPNAARGGKRPLSSMTPVIVFKGEQPVLVAGSPGGSRIIGIVLNILIHLLDDGMTLQDAVNAPRLINRFGSLELEAHVFDDPAYEKALEETGQDIKIYESFGNAQAILIKEEGLTGASDMRGHGLAEGLAND